MYSVKYPSQYRNVAAYLQATADDISNTAMKKGFPSNVNGASNHRNLLGWPSDDSCIESYDIQ